MHPPPSTPDLKEFRPARPVGPGQGVNGPREGGKGAFWGIAPCHPRPSDSEGKGTHDRVPSPVMGPLPSPRFARLAGDDRLERGTPYRFLSSAVLIAAVTLSIGAMPSTVTTLPCLA